MRMILTMKKQKAREAIVRHDVMSHVYAYGLQCPNAKGIIHLGATSCYVGDNTDLIIMHEGLELLQSKIAAVLANLKKFALEYKDMPCLAFTHFQPAQPTTVGKRAALWAQDLMMDYDEIQHLLDNKNYSVRKEQLELRLPLWNFLTMMKIKPDRSMD